MPCRLTTRFIAFVPDTAAAPRDSYNHLTRYALRESLQVCQNQSYFFACADRGWKDAEPSPRVVIDVFSGTAAACEAKIAYKHDREVDWPALHDLLGHSAQIYNAIELRDDALRLESDFLGLKPVYMTTVEHGAVLASSLRDLAQAFPERIADVDELGVSEFLLFGVPFYGKTLHRGISRLEAGTSVEWRQGRLAISRKRRFVPPAVEGDLSTSQAAKRIKEVTMDAFSKRIEYARLPVALGLSGGFDSRFVAALACEKKVPLHAYSYGEAHHTESICARAVARCLNIPQSFLSYDVDSIFNGLPLYLERVEGQADVMMVQITNLLRIGGSEGTTLLHGYLGDAVSGAHLEWLRSPHPRTPDNVAHDVVSHRGAYSAIDGRSLLEIAGLPVSYEDVMHDIAINLCPEAQAHQNLMLFDCENRQRRSIGSQMAMLGSKFHVIIPNYDRDVLSAYFRLPRMALDDRYILRQVFARYWPELAAIPHAEEGIPILPRLRAMLPFALRDYKHALGRKIVGAERYNRMQKKWRDPFLWRMSHGTANAAHAQRIRGRIDNSIATLREMFGIHLQKQQIAGIVPLPGSDVEPHFGRRLFALAEYGNWIESQMGTRAQAFSA